MRFPSKVTPYKESILAKIPPVVKFLEKKDFSVLSLFNEVKNLMTIKEYIEVLDCLYLLNKVVLKEDILHYVDRNLL